MLKNEVLKRLKGTSSQSTISSKILAAELGGYVETVEQIISELHQERKVNLATVTKNGITTTEVWSTGLIDKEPTQQTIQIMADIDDTPLHQDDTDAIAYKALNKPANVLPEKTWALKLLELIEQHPGITSSEAAKRLNYKYISTALIPGYIHRGDVIAVRNHEHQMTFTLKAGMTAAEVYNKRVRKDTPKAAPIKDSIINFLDQAITEQLSDAPRQDEQKAHEDTSPLTTQIGGDHYKKLGIYQPWNVLQAWLTPEEFRGYMKGTCIAYLARERDKGGDMDIEKGTHTLQGFLKLKTNV